MPANAVAEFPDYFSEQSAGYARFRPVYPDSLFDYLQTIAPGRRHVWDCGCGNGQASQALTSYFDQVLATDASTRQLARAPARGPDIRPGVARLACLAEAAPFAEDSFDLVTVAQALHWFRLDSFYRELERVIRPEGVFAAWCYGLIEISPAVDAVIRYLYRDLLGEYWPPERRHVDTAYQELPMPFGNREARSFTLKQRWTLTELLGYLETWSAARQYEAAVGDNSVVRVGKALQQAWGNPQTRRAIHWPITLVVSRRP